MRTTTQEQAKYTLLESVDKIDHLRQRLSFIMDVITDPGDWFETKSTEGLYFTIHSIWEDLDDVGKSVHINLKAPRGLS